MPGAVPKVSAHTSELIDKEVRRLLDEARGRAAKILNENRDLLNRLSALLIATEVIDGDELKAYVDGTKPIPDPRRPGRSPSRRRPRSGPGRADTRGTRRLDPRPADAGDRQPPVSSWS